MDKKIIAVILLLVAAVIITLWIKGAFSAPPQTGVHVRIKNSEFIVDVADTIPAQSQGLSGRESLAADHGMLFVFKPARAEAFWMHAMKFPIDIIWIRDGAVVGFEQNAPVPTGIVAPMFSSPGPVNLVLEVAAGTVAQEGILIGDSVSVSGYTK